MLEPQQQELLADLLLEWEEHAERGEILSAEELCQDHPLLIPHAAEQMAALQKMNERFGGSDTDTALDTSAGPSASSGATPTDRNLDTAATYQVQAFHAKGGRAEVYVANDTSLGRRVAIKSLQPHGADRIGQARLLREAQITSRLEHPGVVPIYGLGTDDRGQPFYSMRFVTGRTLAEAAREFHTTKATSESTQLDRHNLRFVRLLRRVIDVCQTVGFAHEQGVIHRDLKPENVVLGDFGETFVIDWGLAREQTARDKPDANALSAVERGGLSKSTPNVVERSAIETIDHEPIDPTDSSSDSKLLRENASPPGDRDDEQLTQTGAAMGTPAYMAPEQAMGDTASINEATDIFNLGALLYVVLTGQAPYGGSSLADLLSRAQAADYPSPRDINRQTPKPLAAICRRAMARAPRDRYPSAADTADDLEAWLADRPVSCYSDPLPVRLRRMGRRHRTLVSTLLGLLVAGVIAVGVGAYIVGEKNKLIEANYRTAKQAVDNAYGEVSDNPLLNMPGLQPVRNQILAQIVDFYGTFHEQRQDDADLSYELAVNARRLGESTHKLDGAEQAIPVLQQAQTLLGRQRSSLAGRGVDESPLEAARIDRALAQALWGNGQEAEAESLLAERISILDSVAGEANSSISIQEALAETLLLQAELFYASDSKEQSLSALQRAHQVYLQLQKRAPDQPPIQRGLASVLQRKALWREDSTTTDEPRKHLQEAHQLITALLAADPAHLQERQQQAQIEGQIGSTFVDENNTEQARPWFIKSRDHWQALVIDFPGAVEFRFELGRGWAEIGRCALAAQNHSAATQAFRQAESAFDVANHRDAWLINVRALALKNLAGEQYAAQQVYEALANYRLALRDSAQLDVPLRKLVLQSFCGSLLVTGVNEWEAGQGGAAGNTFAEAINQADQLIELEPQNAMWWQLRGAARMGRVMGQVMQNDLAAGKEGLLQSLQDMEQALTLGAEPANASFGISTAYFVLAGIEEQLENNTAAEEATARSEEYMPTDAESLYQMARQYAKESLVFGKGKTAYSPTDLQYIDRYQRQALLCLQRANDAGFTDTERLQNDPAFVGLYESAEFREMLDEG